MKADQLGSVTQLRALYDQGKLFVPPPMAVVSDQLGDGSPSGEGDADKGSEGSGVSDGDNDLSESEGDSSEDDEDTSDSEGDSSEDTSDSSSSDGSQNERGCTSPATGWTTDPLDITVTFDGTWSKRGFTAMHGVVVVISWDTGWVLDAHVISRYCGKCTRMRRSLGLGSEAGDETTSVEFQQWFKLHEPECTLNHKGSSNSMEVEGALVLWNRSVERLNLRYVNVISDGDSKAIAAVRAAKPYGEDVSIVKFECVGHVQKCVGAA